MPRLIDSPSRFQTVAAAISHLILTGGMDAVTMRAIAGESRVSVGTLAYQFTDRARLVDLAAHTSGHERLLDIDRRLRDEGVLAFLPSSADDVARTKVWLSWCAYGRGRPDIAQRIAWLVAEEQRLLRSVHEEPTEHAYLDGLTAIVRGLNEAVCADVDPMPVARARATLARHLHLRLVETT